MSGDAQRLDAFLANAGVATRSEARRLIRRGHVTVAGLEARRADAVVAPGDEVKLGDELIAPLPVAVVYHKPPGVLTSVGDPRGREHVGSALPPRWRGRLHPVGRLDADTRGLLLFFREGADTQWILHPRRAIEREYVARTDPAPGPALATALAAGVATSDGVHTARVLEIEGSAVRLAVTEGRHRMVRRMLNNAGHPVVDLMRVRFGAFSLGALAEGAWRHASEEELAWLANK